MHLNSPTPEPIIVTPPILPGVFLHEFKSHARITHDDEDDTLTGYLNAATQHFQRRTGRTVYETVYDLALDRFPCVRYPLPMGFPSLVVSSVKYTDSDGTETTVDAADYEVDSYYGRISPAYGMAWPTEALRRQSGVVIRYKAGIPNGSPQLYAEDGIRQCILEMATSLYENREHVTVAERESVAAYTENIVTRTALAMYRRRYAF